MATTMTYGSYPFTPVPLMSISREQVKTGDGVPLSELYSINLQGSLVLTSGSGGIISIDSMQDDLLAAMSGDGKLFEVKCDSSVLLQCYPRIRNVNFSPGIWVFRSDYTIDLDFDEIAPGSGSTNKSISSASEEWQVEFSDEKAYHTWNLPDGSGADTIPYQLRLTHTLNATGKSHYNSGGLVKPAWQAARDYVVPRLGYNSSYIQNSGVFNLNVSPFSAYNHVRSTSIGEKDGTFAVTETWMVINSGAGIAGRALEDYNITFRTGLETSLNTINIEGTIQGLETRSYGTNPGDFNVTETKFQSASGYWNVVKDRLLGRGNIILDTYSTTRDLNIIPRSQSIGHNPTTGVITYAYEYDDRPSNCIAGSKSEVITITDNNPSDVFGNLTVLGKANGPVLQEIGTQTAFTRELSIEVVMNPATGCPTDAANAAFYLAQRPTTAVNTLVNAFQGDLELAYSQVFKTQDNVSWNPREGRYSRNVGWIAGGC